MRINMKKKESVRRNRLHSYLGLAITHHQMLTSATQPTEMCVLIKKNIIFFSGLLGRNAEDVFTNVYGECVLRIHHCSRSFSKRPGRAYVSPFLGNPVAQVYLVKLFFNFISFPMLPRYGLSRSNAERIYIRERGKKFVHQRCRMFCGGTQRT